MDLEKLSDPIVWELFKNEVSTSLTRSEAATIENHWSQLEKILYTAGLNNCGTTTKHNRQWISAGSLALLDNRRSIPVDCKNHSIHLALKHRLIASLRSDRERCWLDKAAEMEIAAATGNARKLFQIIRDSGTKTPGVSELICELDGTVIQNLHRRLDRWAEHFKLQFTGQPPHLSLSPPSRYIGCLHLPTCKT